MSFPGAGAGAGGAPGGVNPNDPNDAVVKQMKTVMDSCYITAALSGVTCLGLGGFFGMLTSALGKLPGGSRNMGSPPWSTAKSCGKIGVLFSGISCGLEGLRSKKDMVNSIAAGCVTGAILVRGPGLQAAAAGCAGFAAFSAAIDASLGRPKDED